MRKNKSKTRVLIYPNRCKNYLLANFSTFCTKTSPIPRSNTPVFGATTLVKSKFPYFDMDLTKQTLIIDQTKRRHLSAEQIFQTFSKLKCFIGNEQIAVV